MRSLLPTPHSPLPTPRSVGSWLGQALLALALMAVLGWPAAATLRAAWSGGEGGAATDKPVDALGGRGMARPLALAGNTARLVAITEAIALPLGLPLALLLFRTDLWGRRGLLGVLVLALFVPMPLHATAWIGAIGNVGRAQAFGTGPVLKGLAGAGFVHAMAALPWVVLLAGVGLRTVEPELEEAALLDRPGVRVLAGTTLRRGRGAIAAAALVVAVLTTGDMTVTDLLNVRTYAEESYLQYQLTFDPRAPAAVLVAVPPLAVLGTLVLVAGLVLLRSDPARLPSPSRQAKIWRLGRWRVPLGLGVSLLAGTVLLLPVSGLIWRAGRVGGNAALGLAPRWSPGGLVVTVARAAGELAGPLVQSLAWAGLGATLAVAIAWPFAWLARRPGPWRGVAATAIALALACPGPEAGMALILAYHPIPWLADATTPPLLLILAYVLRTLPFAFLVLWPALRTLPQDWLEAAAVEGCGPWRQVIRVALPLSRGALAAGWGVAFVLALGELPAANLVEPPGSTTLTKRIWELLHYGTESHLAGVALVTLGTIGALGLVVGLMLLRLFGAEGWSSPPPVARPEGPVL